MAAALWISAVGFAAGMFALGWELGLRWCAAALPLLALTDHAWPGGLVFDADIVHKLTFFQTEDSGRMCMLAALVLAVPLLRGDAGAGLPRAVATGALIGAAALTHLVAVIGIAPLMAGYAVAAAVRSGRWRAIARWSIATAAGGLAVAAMALVLAGGDLGFQGASGTPYRAVNGRYDPTAALLGLKKTPIPKSRRRFYTPPVTAARNLYSTATALPAHGRTLVLPLLALGLLGLAAVLLGGRPERLAVAAALFALASLYAIELLFSARYAYYVPATFGDRRVFEYAGLPLLVLGAAGVNALFGRTRQLRPRLPAVCAAALPLLIVAGIGWNGLTAGVHGGPAVSSMIEAARVATPCNTRLLTPTRTRGSFQALTGRASMQEGLMVFLRPALLAQALDIEARARRFYADPAANADLLRRWSIDYVLARPDQAKRLMRPARAEPARAGRAGLGVRGGRGRRPTRLAPTTCPGTAARASRCDDRASLHASRSAGAGRRRRGRGHRQTAARRRRDHGVAASGAGAEPVSHPQRVQRPGRMGAAVGSSPGAADGRRRPGGADGAGRRAHHRRRTSRCPCSCWTRCTRTGPSGSSSASRTPACGRGCCCGQPAPTRSRG